MKLDPGTKHLLRLVAQDPNEEGWTKVSDVVWPLLDTIPNELIERRPAETGGHVRLTDKGETVLFYT